MPQEFVEALVFEVEGQRYGLPVGDVRELLRAVALTPVPLGPDLVEGVVNIRGQVVPVVNLRRWLRLPARPLEHTDNLIVTQLRGRLAALRVDRALMLTRLEPAAVETARNHISVGSPVAQAAKSEGGLVLLLDLATLLLPASPGAAAQLTSEEEGTLP